MSGRGDAAAGASGGSDGARQRRRSDTRARSPHRLRLPRSDTDTDSEHEQQCQHSDHSVRHRRSKKRARQQQQCGAGRAAAAVLLAAACVALALACELSCVIGTDTPGTHGLLWYAARARLEHTCPRGLERVWAHLDTGGDVPALLLGGVSVALALYLLRSVLSAACERIVPCLVLGCRTVVAVSAFGLAFYYFLQSKYGKRLVWSAVYYMAQWTTKLADDELSS